MKHFISVFAAAWIFIWSAHEIKAQWVQTNGPIGGKCLAVSPEGVNDSNIFAGTYNGVFRSTNNGDNWTQVNSGLPNSIFGPPSINTLTVSPNGAGGTNIYAGGGGGVFLSTNNGTSWKTINDGLADVTDIAVIPASDGTGNTKIFVATATIFDLWNWDYYGGGVFLSTNNGSTWTSINDGLTTKDVYALAVSGKNLFAGTYHGVFRSTNNGTSWTRAGSELEDIDVSTLVVNGTSLFAGTLNNSFSFGLVDGGAYGMGEGVWLTTNNGISWQNGYDESVTRLDIHDLALVSNGAGGINIFAGTSGGVFLSHNNGKSWTPASTGLTDTTVWSKYTNVWSLSVSGTNLFAGTEHGVWRRPLSEMITTDVEEYHASLPEGYSLEQNYPNPFNPSTRIEFSIPRAEYVTLKVYDVLGREVAVLANSALTPGNYKVIFNRNDLASGVYFYRIQAGEFVQTKKLVLQR
jgi:hypothetical protein